MKKIYIAIIVLTVVKNGFSQTKTSLPTLGKSPVKEVIAAMTREEKVKLLVGNGMNFPGLAPDQQGPVVGQTVDRVAGAAGTTFAIPRLGIPSIVLADGPAGLRILSYRNNDSSVSYFCTAFPIATSLASTLDQELVRKVGNAMGNEVKEYGVDILLAPALNIHRNPLGGRNFEYYSEDPVVSGKMAAAMVNGIQEQGVGTSIKHFAANNHEWNRNTINVIVGERALREIYLKGFQIATKESQPWTVMSSYNKINGTYTSERKDLLSTILRNEWKYKGFVMTDWFGGSDPIAQVRAGNDLLMPGTAKQVRILLEALENNTLDEKSIDQNVEKILNIIVRTPAFAKYDFSNKPDLKAHAVIARLAAAEGMVLLKNDASALPLSPALKIAAFGNSSYKMITGGTGSGDVNEAYTVSLIDGLKASGFSVNDILQKTYSNYLDEQQKNQPKQRNSFLLPPPVPENEIEGDLVNRMSVENDVALITIGRNSGEFADRKLENDYYLSTVEKSLIQRVSEAFHAKGKKVLVILNTGGVMEMASWLNFADAILLGWQPGQEAGYAITDVLSGKINPSGKLATTIPLDYKDASSSKGFPGKVLEPADPKSTSIFPVDKAAEVVYEEEIYTGYRYYEKAKVKPLYEFGYGMSYTNFSYEDLKLNSTTFNNQIKATVTVSNIGELPGKEVVQLYIAAPSSRLGKPLQELKAFAKTRMLQPGESETITFTIKSDDLASFNANNSAWVAESGTYTLKIGASSLKIAESKTFTLAKDVLVEKVNKALTPMVTIGELKFK